MLSHAPENVTARFTLRRALLKLHLPQQAADEFAKVAESVAADDVAEATAREEQQVKRQSSTQRLCGLQLAPRRVQEEGAPGG